MVNVNWSFLPHLHSRLHLPLLPPATTRSLPLMCVVIAGTSFVLPPSAPPSTPRDWIVSMSIIALD